MASTQHYQKSLLQIHAEMEEHAKQQGKTEERKRTMGNHEKLQNWLDGIGEDLLSNVERQPIVDQIMRNLSGESDSQCLQWYGAKDVLYNDRWAQPPYIRTGEMISINNTTPVVTVLFREGHILDGCALKLCRTRDCDSNPVAIGIAMVTAGLIGMHDTGIEIRLFYDGRDSQINKMYQVKKREADEKKAADAALAKEKERTEYIAWLEEHRLCVSVVDTTQEIIELATYKKGEKTGVWRYLENNSLSVKYDDLYNLEARLVYNGLMGTCLGVQIVLVKTHSGYCLLF